MQYLATVGHINCYAVLKKVMLFRCLCRYVIWESKGSYEWPQDLQFSGSTSVVWELIVLDGPKPDYILC
jgi:hypothetical protein